ncbi:class I SAM-dependent DNA methyltransferase [Microbulbifer zhoushanensis]|uniref:class I SAM-dependent DNA methyltransferase n=1 Tax=Microbulbifer zhoushanensis TaxID=2904254 RepID=UPI001F417BC1|nr:DNA methyltransferase [Microbulbifer zhoushanensis]
MSLDVSRSLKNLSLPHVEAEGVQAFISRWKNTQGSGAELADFQSFLRDLCDALNLPKPDPKSDASKANEYIFERPVDIYDATGAAKPGKNRIDLYRRDCFVMEAKQTDREIGSQSWYNAMQKAKNQADEYVRSLPGDEGRPPFIVLVDVGRSIQLYAEFSRSGGIYVPFPDPGHYTIKLEDISEPAVQQRLQCLWLAPDSLDPSKYAAEVTRDVSARLAELAKSLEQAGFRVDRTAHFLKRCLFTMFSEDVGLIPEGSFTSLLERLRQRPEHFVPAMESLWRTMNAGGFEGQLEEILPRFNGGLFTDIDPIPLDAQQIELLIEAARADWRYVEPAIFGTLLERALDPRERHKLGAHFTPRSYVERLVMPTVIEPLRKEWSTVKVEVEMHLQAGKDAKALECMRQFHYRLCSTKVLDPACGSGNFLYVALEHLKRLEGEVLNRLRDLSAGQTSFDTEGLTVDPHQFLGLELNPRAAAIAEIVLWIGYLQWHFKINGKLDLPEPILRDFKNIENRDALIEFEDKVPVKDEAGEKITIWDGISYKASSVTGKLVPDETGRLPLYHYIKPSKAEWPEADFIVGNPPFIGDKAMRRALGGGYVDAIRKVWGELAESTDFVMYWWHIAAQKVRAGSVKQFGFITTNSLRQTFNRRVIETHLNDNKKPLSIAFAIPDHPWVDSNDGASVRIAMTVGVAGERSGLLRQVLREESGEDEASNIELASRQGKIFSDLTVGANVAGAGKLLANGGISSNGMMLAGSGFIVTQDEAESLGYGVKPELSEIVHPYRNGRDLAQSPRGVMLIDLYGYEAEEVREKFPHVYQWILERVKPERDNNRRKRLKEKWWLFGEVRKSWRSMSEGLSKYIATVETTKHRVFTVLDKTIKPDHMLVNIAVENNAILGVLSSRVHVCWALAAGGRLGVGNDPRYNKSRCFETFPFPVLSDFQAERIGKLAARIDAQRKERQAEYSSLTLTGIYNVLDKLRRDEALTEKEQEINSRGLVSTLRELHDELDREVMNAYGWSDLAEALVGLPGATTPLVEKAAVQTEAEEELLARLVRLNHRRALDEIKGRVHWLRPEYQSPESEQDGIDIVSAEASDADKQVATAQKSSWPQTMAEQISSVLDCLQSPATTEQIAGSFKRKPVKGVEAVLHALLALGKVNDAGGKWVRV